MNGIPKPGPNEKLVSGSEVFKNQLSLIPKRKLTTQELIDAFDPLFADIEKMDYPKEEALQRAKELSEKHPIPAFGYPRNYIRIVAKDLTRDKFYEMVSINPND